MKPAIACVVFTVSVDVPVGDEELVQDLSLKGAAQDIIRESLDRTDQDYEIASWDSTEIINYGDFAPELLECPGCETQWVLAEDVAYIRKHGMCHACRRKAKIEQLRNALSALTPATNWQFLPLEGMADLALSLEDDGKSFTL